MGALKWLKEPQLAPDMGSHQPTTLVKLTRRLKEIKNKERTLSWTQGLSWMQWECSTRPWRQTNSTMQWDHWESKKEHFTEILESFQSVCAPPMVAEPTFTPEMAYHYFQKSALKIFFSYNGLPMWVIDAMSQSSPTSIEFDLCPIRTSGVKFTVKKCSSSFSLRRMEIVILPSQEDTQL